jgi:hypothetical protein
LWGGIIGTAPDYNHVYNELKASIKYSGVGRTLYLDDKTSIEFGLIDMKPDLVIGDPGPHSFSRQDKRSLKAFDD